MRKKALAVVAALTALAALAAAAYSRAPAVAVPRAFAPVKEGRLLAVVPGVRGPVLGRADKRALWIARRSPRLRLFNPGTAWTYSPHGNVLAIATERGGEAGDPVSSLQLIDPHVLSRLATVKLGYGHVAQLAWADNRVNAVVQRWCCPASLDVVGVNAETAKIVSQQTFQNALVGSSRVGSTLVLLLAPPVGIGTATLAVVDPSGAIHTVSLNQIQAGSDLPDEDNPAAANLHQNRPGLAVDPDGNRAFVVPASGSVAEISLATLSVSYHALAEPVSLLGRLHSWAEPKAVAKGISGPTRAARWLGSGVIAVTGGDEAVTATPGEMHITWTPAGLKLIDTNTWGAKLIDRGADSFTVDRDQLLATGAAWDTTGNRQGMGLADYGFDGTRRLAVLGGHPAVVTLVFRGRAYVGVDDERSIKVVDLESGKLKDRHAPLAQLLLGDGSN